MFLKFVQRLRVPSPRILIQLPMARRTTVAVWLLALAPAFVAPEWWRKGHGQSIKSGAFFHMDPIDSAGVGLDPNELGFVHPYFLKGNMYGKLWRENIVAGLMTSHKSKSLGQKNV